jgi:hypothetical protein
MTLQRDPVDPRDWLYEVSPFGTVPESRILADRVGEIEDQGTTNSCTANGLISCFEMIAGGNWSRLFNYRYSRMLAGVFHSDTGSTCRAALRAAQVWGTPPEDWFPFAPQYLTQAPMQQCMDVAAKHKIGGYYRIDHVDTIKKMDHALASGYPIFFSIDVTNEFRSVGSGVFEPHDGRASIGYHAMACYGYDKDFYYVENSWGMGFGVNGTCKVRKSVFTKNAIDIWVVKGFSGKTGAGENMVTYDMARAVAIKDYLKLQFAPIVEAAIVHQVSPEEIDAAMKWPVGTTNTVLGL